MQLAMVSFHTVSFFYVFSFSVESGSLSTRYTCGTLGFLETALSPPTSYRGARGWNQHAPLSLQNANPHPVRVSRDSSCQYRYLRRRVQLIGNWGDSWFSPEFYHQTVPLYESLQFCNLSVSKYFSLDFHCIRSFIQNSVWIVKRCLYTNDSPISGRNHVGLHPTSEIVYNWRAGRGPDHYDSTRGYRC